MHVLAPARYDRDAREIRAGIEEGSIASRSTLVLRLYHRGGDPIQEYSATKIRRNALRICARDESNLLCRDLGVGAFAAARHRRRRMRRRKVRALSEQSKNDMHTQRYTHARKHARARARTHTHMRQLPCQ
jgi:hypothetical protein